MKKSTSNALAFCGLLAATGTGAAQAGELPRTGAFVAHLSASSISNPYHSRRIGIHRLSIGYREAGYTVAGGYGYRYGGYGHRRGYRGHGYPGARYGRHHGHPGGHKGRGHHYEGHHREHHGRRYISLGHRHHGYAPGQGYGYRGGYGYAGRYRGYGISVYRR